MTVSIEHTEAEGTLLHGTFRGDGSGDVVKALGWRWGRSIGLWFLPRSREAAPKRPLIEQTAQQLRAAGFEVEVLIDATVGDRDQGEQRRARRAEERADHLEGRADREQKQAMQQHAAYRKIADGIPFGQPILAGHHSQAKAERDARRIRSHMDASLEHQERANAARAAAATATASTGARHNPVTVANRIDRLGAEIRRQERALVQLEAAGPGNAHRQAVQDQLAIDRADLEHWERIRAEQIGDGRATNYGRDTVTVGDQVKVRGQWYVVARCNTKTVAVQTGHSWTRKTPWHEVTEHRPLSQ